MTDKTKENEMSKINWDNAPDWATHAVYRKISGLIIYFNNSKYMYDRDKCTVYNYSDSSSTVSTFKEYLLGAEERPNKDGKLYVEDFGAIPMSKYENDHDKQVDMNIDDMIEDAPKEWSTKGIDFTFPFDKQTPKEWNGEGLPPVGTVCEVVVDSHLINSGVYTVFGLFDGHVWLVGKIGDHHIKRLNDLEIKPVDKRTDKEKAIDEMICVLCEGGFKGVYYDNLACLYDAGYRKEDTSLTVGRG